MLTVILVGPGVNARAFGRWAEETLRHEPAVFFVGVDGGLDVILTAGLPVGLAIGDWDSLSSKKVLKEVSHVTLEKKKDRSDFRAALEFAQTLKATRVIAYGFQGGLFDQELGVLADLKSFATKFTVLEWVGERGLMRFVTPRQGVVKFGFKKGSRFSVYAQEPGASGVTVSGAEYSLKGEKLLPSSRGLSNVSKGDVRVSVKRGAIAVVVSAVIPAKHRRSR